MLLKLSKTDVHNFWPTIKRALNTVEEGMEEPEKVLEAMLDGTIQCWLMADEKEEIIGFITTQIGSVEPQGKKILIIRDLYSLNGIPDEIVIDSQRTLEQFAHGNMCKEIVGYTNNKFAVTRAKQLGYKISTMVVKEV